MTDENQEPKIIVDEDWKSQVEAEKEQLKESMEQDEPHPDMPPASFELLISMLGTQAMSAMGQIPDPMTGELAIAKPFARHYIDLLAMLDEKTKGNLTEDESSMLTNMLHQLRMVFVATPDEMPAAPAEDGGGSSTIELP